MLLSRSAAQRPQSLMMAKFAFPALTVALVTLLSIRQVAGGDCSGGDLLGHWPFDGTFDDISPNQLGPAEPAWDRSPVGGNIKLTWGTQAVDTCNGFLKVGNPGFLQVPRVDFHDISFTFSLSLRLNGQMSDRRILYADWSAGEWAFMSWVTPDRLISVWMRNGAQDTFVYVSSTVKVPLGAWVHVAFSWDRKLRVASVFINRVLAGQQVVGSNVRDINLFKSSSYYYQLGSKADSASQTSKDYAPLDADVSNLRVYKGLALTLPSHIEQVIEQ